MESTETVKEPKKLGMSQKHKDLQDRAIQWLYDHSCSVFAKEVPTENGNADALGIRTPRHGKSVVYYIEAKASRSDLICQKQKKIYEKSVGFNKRYMCYVHGYGQRLWNDVIAEEQERRAALCNECKALRAKAGDTGIDFYYLIVADDVRVEESLYPEWGVIDERGQILRRAKRMRREGDHHNLVKEIAHVLVYKCFGKMYLNEYKNDV